jgi:hypothetical protein
MEYTDLILLPAISSIMSRCRETVRPFSSTPVSELLKKGSEKARPLTRCRILLLADSGQSKKEIQECPRDARTA